MSVFADQVIETSSSDQSARSQNVINGTTKVEPATQLLGLHFYIDAHTKILKCCCCKKRITLKVVRYLCRSCHEASLCEDCANNDKSSDHKGYKGQGIDLSRIVQVRKTLKYVTYTFTEEDLAFLAPTEENQRYVTNLIHQLGLRQDFCIGCMDVTPGNIYKDWLSKHVIHVSKLKDFAEAGCATCSIAYRGLLKIAPQEVARNKKVKWHIWKKQIKVTTRSHLEGRQGYLIRANQGQPKPWETLTYAPFQTPTLRSDETFTKIRSWIKSCENSHSHEQCTRQGDALLPRRVVYIHPNNEASDGSTMLSLQETNVGAFGKYIALSHCWGTEPVLKTTRTNFQQLCRRIGFSDLPLTFRDAVRCARGIGVPYLWIDSLCIIQDDVRDWEVESAKMSSIYRDAYLVIAAAASSSSQGGMLFERPALTRGKPFESKEGSGVLDLVVQEEMPHAKRQFPSTMISSPISSRAWCMQELILARRSVSFFKEELIWECHSCVECECGKLASSSSTADMTNMENYETAALWLDPKAALFGDIYTIRYKRKPYNLFASRKSIMNEWRHLTVPAYTARSLTKPIDRLPAAAGIASLIATKYKQDYLAGIWRGDLKCGLMWSVPPSQQPAPAPDDYIAPSFSWASVNREVEYICTVPTICESTSVNGEPKGGRKFAYGNVECELVEASVEPSGANPLGCVKVGSYIRLRGLSMRIILRLKDGKYSLSHIEETGGKDHPEGSLAFHPDCALREVKFHPANDPRRGCVKSVNRSKTVLGPDDEFEAEVDALVLADFCRFLGNWSRDCCAFIVLGFSHSHDNSCERLGLGCWSFTRDDLNGNWKNSAQYRDYKIV